MRRPPPALSRRRRAAIRIRLGHSRRRPRQATPGAQSNPRHRRRQIWWSRNRAPVSWRTSPSGHCDRRTPEWSIRPQSAAASREAGRWLSRAHRPSRVALAPSTGRADCSGTTRQTARSRVDVPDLPARSPRRPPRRFVHCLRGTSIASSRVWWGIRPTSGRPLGPRANAAARGPRLMTGIRRRGGLAMDQETFGGYANEGVRVSRLIRFIRDARGRPKKNTSGARSWHLRRDKASLWTAGPATESRPACGHRTATAAPLESHRTA